MDLPEVFTDEEAIAWAKLWEETNTKLRRRLDLYSRSWLDDNAEDLISLHFNDGDRLDFVLDHWDETDDEGISFREYSTSDIEDCCKDILSDMASNDLIDFLIEYYWFGENPDDIEAFLRESAIELELEPEPEPVFHDPNQMSFEF
jgi:hypothetical protein